MKWHRILLSLLILSTASLSIAEEWKLETKGWRWQGSGKASVTQTDGQLNLRLYGSYILTKSIPLKAKWKGILFTFRMKTEKVVKGKQHWADARFQVLFYDRNGKQVGGWPPFATATGTSDRRREMFYKIPSGASEVRISPSNLGVSGKVEFLDLRVYPMETDKVTDLDARPPEGSAEDHMSLRGAETLKNGQREQICLNGLWQFYPLKNGVDPALQLPAKGSGWCWFKVPGAWPSWGNQTAESAQAIIVSPFATEKIDTLKLNEAWYRRIFTVPAEWKGRRILLNFTMLQTNAQVLVDGKRAGEVYFPGGELDLTGKLLPGKQQELAILVTANPGKSNVHFMAPDVIINTPAKLGFRGITGDLYLSAIPSAGNIRDVRITTSVRRQTISCNTALEHLPPGEYLLKAEIFDGSAKVREFRSEPFRIAKESPLLRKTFSATWKNPKLWDTNHPENLYRATITLLKKDGSVIDTLFPEEFGFREFWTSGRNFYLNGSVIHLRQFAHGLNCGAANISCRENVVNVLKRVKEANFNSVFGVDYAFRPGQVGYIDHTYRESSKLGLLTALTLPHAAQYNWNLDDPKENARYRRHAEHLIRRFQNLPGIVMYAMTHNATGDIADQNPLKMGMPNTFLENNKTMQALKAEAIVRELDPDKVIYHHAGSPGNGIFGVNCYLNWAPVQERSDWFEHWEKHGTRPLMLSEWGLPHRASYSSFRGGAGIWFRKNPQCFWVEEYNAEHLGEEAYRLTQDHLDFLEMQTKNTGNKPIYFSLDGDKLLRTCQTVLKEFVGENFPEFRIRGLSSIAPWDSSWFWDKLNPQWIFLDNPDAFRNLKRPGISPDRFHTPGTRFAWKETDGTGAWKLTKLGETVAEAFADRLAMIAGKPGDFSEKGHNFRPGETVSKQLIVVNDSRENLRVLCKASVPELNLNLEKELTIPTGSRASMPVQFRIPEKFTGKTICLNAEFLFPDQTRSTDSIRLDVIRPIAKKTIRRLGLYDPEGTAAPLLKELGLSFRNIRTQNDLAGIELLVIGRKGMKEFPFKLAEKIENGLKLLVLEQEYEDLLRMGLRGNIQGLRKVFPLSPEFEHLHWWRGSSTLTTPFLELPEHESGYPSWKFNDMYSSRVWRAGNRGNVCSVLIEKAPAGNFLPLMQGGFDLQYAPLLEMKSGKGTVLFSQLDLSGRTESDPEALTILRKLLDRLEQAKPHASRPVVYRGGAEGKALLKKLNIAFSETEQLPSNALLTAGPGAKLADLKGRIKNGLDVLVIAPEKSELERILPAGTVLESGRFFPAYVSGLEKHPEFAGISNADLHWRKPITLSFDPSGDGGRALRIFRIGKGRLIVSLIAPWMFEEQEFQYRTSFRRSAFLLSRLLRNLGAADASGSAIMFDRDYLAARGIELKNGWKGIADPQKTGRKNGFWKPEFKPGSNWRAVKVNSSFESQFRDLRNYDGFFWYRLNFDLKGEIRPDAEYLLNIPAVDDESWCWLNGRFIGELSARTNPNDYWYAKRMHRFKGNLLKKRNNTLVILCNDLRNTGGIWGIPAIKAADGLRLYADTPVADDNPYRYSRW